MIVKILSYGKYLKAGYIRFENGKVKLESMSDDNKKFFSEIGLGPRCFKPSDGLEYMEAVITAFCRSTAILLCKEKQDKEWMSVEKAPSEVE